MISASKSVIGKKGNSQINNVTVSELAKFGDRHVDDRFMRIVNGANFS